MRIKSLAANLAQGTNCREPNSQRAPISQNRRIAGIERRLLQRILIFGLAFGLQVTALPAIAIPFTVTFEEVGPAPLPGVNPPTIGPFTFTPGALVVSLTGPNDLGFFRDRWSASPSNVISLGPAPDRFSGFIMYLTEGGEFDFLSAYFANSHPAGPTITLLGYSNGQVAYQTDVCGLACFIPVGGSPLREEFNYTGIDRLEIRASFFPFGLAFVDDLEFDVRSPQSVPESSTATLALLGLLILWAGRHGRFTNRVDL